MIKACVQVGPNLTEDLWDTENLLQSDHTGGRDPVSCYTQKVKEKDKRGKEEEEKKGRKKRKKGKARDFMSPRLFNTKKVRTSKLKFRLSS